MNDFEDFNKDEVEQGCALGAIMMLIVVLILLTL